MIKEIEALGRHVEQAWAARGCEFSAFPEVATVCLAEHRLHERIDAEVIIRWALAAKDVPRQLSLSADFGDPPITLYDSDKFVIDAYFWLEPKTDCHDHSFSGAFTVVRGLSFHSTYGFVEAESYARDILLGRLEGRRNELLRAGEVRTIRSGPSLIHRVWHLTRPSLSVVVRTKKELDVQYAYMAPGVGVDFRAQTRLARSDAAFVKKAAFLKYMTEIGHPDVDRCAKELIRISSPLAALRHITSFMRAVPDAERVADLFRTAVAAHGKGFETIEAAYGASAALHGISWHRLTEEAPRLLLALLFSTLDRQVLFRFIDEAYPGKDPQELVVAWLREISDSEALYFRITDGLGDVIKALMRGGGDEGVFAALAEQGLVTPGEESRRKLGLLCDGLRAHELLGPLFREAPSPAGL